MIQIRTQESNPTMRRIYFQLVDATDGMTPETGEAGGQPELSFSGGAWSSTEVGTLVHIGNGRYYAELTANGVDSVPFSIIESRYKSANTAEALGTTVQIVGDIYTEMAKEATLSGIPTSINASTQYRACQIINSTPIFLGHVSNDQSILRDLFIPMNICDYYTGSAFIPTHATFYFYETDGTLIGTITEADAQPLIITVIDNVGQPGSDILITIPQSFLNSIFIARKDSNLMIEYQTIDDSGHSMWGTLSMHVGWDRDLLYKTAATAPSWFSSQFGTNILNTSPIYYNYGQDSNEEIARIPFAYDGTFTDIILEIGGVDANYITLSLQNGDFGTNQTLMGNGETTLNIHAQGRDALDAYILGSYSQPGLKTLVCRMVITGDAGTVEVWRTLVCNLGSAVDTSLLAKEATLQLYQHPYRKINQSPIYHKYGQRSSFPYVGIDDSTGGGFVPTDVTLYLYTDQHIGSDILTLVSPTHIQIYEQDYFSGEGTFKLTPTGVTALDSYLSDTVEKVCWCSITMTNGGSTASAYRVMICNQGGSGVSLSEIEASAVLAKEGTLNSMSTAMAKETTLESIRATELTNIQNTLNSIEVSGAGEATLIAISGQVADLHNEAFGKWDIDYIAKTLTLYRADNTVLKIFDLTEAAFNSIRPYKTRTPR